MTEEIKELLDILNKVKDYDDKRYFISCGENDYLLTNDEIKCLLNYITNLQKENEELKEIINDNMTVYLKGLEDGKDKMKEIFESVYKSRNEKAIEFIKEWWYEKNTRDINRIVSLGDKRIDLLNILKGDDE